jgi:PKD repeat protein
LDPIPNNIVNGDQVTLMARTSLPAGTEVFMDVVSKPAPIGSTTAQEFAGTAGVVQVTQDTGSANITSFSFNTDHFITEVSNPYTYLITAESPVFNIRCQTEFRLLASKPIANFTAYPTSGFAPLNVTFIETSTRSPSSWLWNFGDGTLSMEESPLHSYRNPGVYTVSLTAINQLGENSVMKKDLISVYPDTFPATADTYISSATVPTAGPNRRITSPRQINYGSEPLLSIVRGNRSRNIYLNWQGALIRVDLPPIPVDLVERVTLNLYHGNPYREDIAVYRMLTGWKEKEVTYDRPNAGAPSWAGGWVPGTNYAMESTTKVSISQTGRWYTIDVTADVKAFLSGSAQNHGWFLKSAETIGDDGDSTAFVSREGRIGQRPYVRFEVKKPMISSTLLESGFYNIDREIYKWSPINHQTFAYDSCIKMGLSKEWSDVVRMNADDPDYWGYPPFDPLYHASEHYWNPDWDGNEIIIGFGRYVGYGAINCHKYTSLAKEFYQKNKNSPDAYINLGYGSHFLTDLGNPMHTGKILETIGDLSRIHNKYEEYVSLNWSEGEQLSFFATNDNSYYKIANPGRSAKSIARYSHSYLNLLYDSVSGQPIAFCDETTQIGKIVKSISEKCILYTARNNNGLVKYTLDNDGGVKN